MIKELPLWDIKQGEIASTATRRLKTNDSVSVPWLEIRFNSTPIPTHSHGALGSLPFMNLSTSSSIYAWHDGDAIRPTTWWSAGGRNSLPSSLPPDSGFHTPQPTWGPCRPRVHPDSAWTVLDKSASAAEELHGVNLLLLVCGAHWGWMARVPLWGQIIRASVAFVLED